MIATRFDDLRRRKALREQRDISLRKVAVETGLALSTVQRLSKGDAGRVYLSTLNVLGNYFGLSEIGELIAFVPDTSSAAPQDVLVKQEVLVKNVGTNAVVSLKSKLPHLEPDMKHKHMTEELAGLKDRHIPQTLDDLTPRQPPPPGMTAMQTIRGQWPGDETEEQLLADLAEDRSKARH